MCVKGCVKVCVREGVCVHVIVRRRCVYVHVCVAFYVCMCMYKCICARARLWHREVESNEDEVCEHDVVMLRVKVAER